MPITEQPSVELQELVSQLEIWWSGYRANRAMEWQKSPANPYKPQTFKQFLADCLRSLGIKGGTVEERIKKAIATHPALYSQSVPT